MRCLVVEIVVVVVRLLVGVWVVRLWLFVAWWLGCLVAWLVACLLGLVVGSLVVWLFGCLVVCLFGCLVVVICLFFLFLFVFRRRQRCSDAVVMETPSPNHRR